MRTLPLSSGEHRYQDIPSSMFKQRTREAVEEYLNGLGDEGWEVVNVDFVEWDGPGSFVGIAKR